MSKFFSPLVCIFFVGLFLLSVVGVVRGETESVTRYLIPTADHGVQWIGYDGGVPLYGNYQCVDDYPSVNDANYVYVSRNGLIDSYTLNNINVSGLNYQYITGVTVYCRAKVTGIASPNKVQYGVANGATYYSKTSDPLTGSYTTLSWTLTSEVTEEWLNGADFRIVVNTVQRSCVIYVSAVWVKVDLESVLLPVISDEIPVNGSTVNASDGGVLTSVNVSYRGSMSPVTYRMTFPMLYTAGDKLVLEQYGDVSWSDVHHALSGYLTPPGLVGTLYESGAFGWYNLRHYFFFNTSNLPDDVSVVSANLSLPMSDVQAYYDFNITLMHDNICPHRPLISSDYDIVNYDGFGGSWNTSSFSVATTYKLKFSNEGLTWINKTNISKFMLLTSLDRNDIDPAVDDPAYFYIGFGSNKLHYVLTVNYTVMEFDDPVNVSFWYDGVQYYNETVFWNKTVGFNNSEFVDGGVYDWNVSVEIPGYDAWYQYEFTKEGEWWTMSLFGFESATVLFIIWILFVLIMFRVGQPKSTIIIGLLFTFLSLYMWRNYYTTFGNVAFLFASFALYAVSLAYCLESGKKGG